MKQLKEDIKQFLPIGIFCLGYFILADIFVGSVCPLVYLTGFPCPACGLTRALGYLLLGKWKEAFMMNPMIYPVVILGIILVIWRYFYAYSWQKIGKKVQILVVFLVLFSIVVYIIRMKLYFPQQIPLVYHKRSLFYWLISLRGRG